MIPASRSSRRCAIRWYAAPARISPCQAVSRRSRTSAGASVIAIKPSDAPGSVAVAVDGLVFTSGQVDAGPGGRLAQAMRDEIAVIYDGLDLDGDAMPRAGAAELGPPGGGFIIGYLDGVLACCGGIKRLNETSCEFKKMY